MSFSSDVKKELAEIPLGARHCLLAELAGIMMAPSQMLNTKGKLEIKLETENPAVARRCFTIIKNAFATNIKIILKNSKKEIKKPTYILKLEDEAIVKKILLATQLIYEEQEQIVIRNQPTEMMVQSICCKRAYLRGAFLVAGSVSHPEKGYHLEFVNSTEERALFLRKVINFFDIDAKIVTRKNNYVVYLKEGSQIVDLLNIMGAHLALMELENIRIVKEVRNKVNRIVNCETANLKKTVSAAVRQMQDIEYIEETIGLQELPEILEEIARFRLEYPSATLKELGEMMIPPVGKSGVNHRLKKLSEIANEIREQRGGAKHA